MSDSQFQDLWDQVVGLETLSHPAHRSRFAGGEWDCVRALPRKRMRMLTGAQLLTPRGLAPDQLESVISGVLGESRITCTEDAVDWYVKHAVLMIEERRRERHARRHFLFAVRQGYSSYWRYRVCVLPQGDFKGNR